MGLFRPFRWIARGARPDQGPAAPISFGTKMAASSPQTEAGHRGPSRRSSASSHYLGLTFDSESVAGAAPNALLDEYCNLPCTTGLPGSPRFFLSDSWRAGSLPCRRLLCLCRSIAWSSPRPASANLGANLDAWPPRRLTCWSNADKPCLIYDAVPLGPCHRHPLQHNDPPRGRSRQAPRPPRQGAGTSCRARHLRDARRDASRR